jgi:cyclopropane fatty-acyl-phospholipid synthase-like methyltransferase
MSILNKFIFNIWYYRRPPWDSGISPPELFEFLAHHPPGRAIDIGCGSGTHVITLVQHGWQTTGIDFAPHAIKIAKRKAQLAAIKADLRVGDATRPDGIRGPFDLAIDFGCFHGLSQKQREQYLGRLDEILTQGGYWFMYGFFKPSLHQNGPGLDPADIELILNRFSLVSRQDGFDRKERKSAYFLFRKP